MAGVLRTDRPEFEGHVVGVGGGEDPAAGEFGTEHVSGGGKVDLMQPVVVGLHAPEVAVAVDVGLHLVAAAGQIEKGIAVDQSGDRRRRVDGNDILALLLGVVMTDEDDRFVGSSGESAVEPLELGPTKCRPD